MTPTEKSRPGDRALSQEEILRQIASIARAVPHPQGPRFGIIDLPGGQRITVRFQSDVSA